MAYDYETIVVGGGISGMSCALKLKENGRDVAIITDELGGRVDYDAELRNNFGAVFYMENYKNAKKIVDYENPLETNLYQLMLHTSPTKVFRGASLTMGLSLPQLLKFQKFMKETFMPEYQKYKDDCEVMPVTEAFEKHPDIKRYYYMKASEVIKELGIDAIADNFVSKFAYACTGCKINELNGLDFLNVTQGVVIPIYNFTFDRDAFTAKLDGKVIIDTIVKVQKQEDASWMVTGEGGVSYTCQNLVVATPGLVTQELLGIEEIRTPTMLVSYLVKGIARGEIRKAQSHYYGDSFDVIALSQRYDGLWNVFSSKEIDLDEFFLSHQVIKYRVWPQALFTYGKSILKQDWDENCYIAGDVNGLGLEPASIAGIYAANRILGVC